MDFELSDDQRAILEAVDGLLARHAGPERAVELAAKAEYDHVLETALAEAGFLELAWGEETGPLEAALVVEEIACAGGTVAAGAAALVAPALLEGPVPGPVALALAGGRGPVRFGAHARTLLVLDRERGEARRIPLSAGDAQAVSSSFGYPMGRVPTDGGTSLGGGSARTLESWWRVAIACEASGAMTAALSVTVEYLTQRRQFGRPIGSFQAVQHRLALCRVLVEGSRWLAYEAAWKGAPSEAAACAVAYASAAAEHVFTETHQLSGAIGFTREHPLHVWSMRLAALRLELGGIAGHREALAEERWLSR